MRPARAPLPRPSVLLGVSALTALLLAAGSACHKERPAPPSPRVTARHPEHRLVTDYLYLNGNTRAYYTVQLMARVEGFLDKVLFKDGQHVTKGQVLFVIQRTQYRANLRQAESQILSQKSQLDHAEREYNRYAALAERKAASQTDVDQWRFARDSARAGLLAAVAARDLAKLDLSYTRVVAPFDGRIDRTLIDPGNLVGTTGRTLLAELNRIDPIYVYFNISDVDLARLREGARGVPVAQRSAAARSAVDDPPIAMGLPGEVGYPHEGRLDFASISLTPTTGTLLVRGVFPNPDERIRAGLYARVRVPVETRTALVVPQAAVLHELGGAYVLLVTEHDKITRRTVETGRQVDTDQIITGGLKDTDWVVVEGQARVHPGERVSPLLENTCSCPAAGPPAPSAGQP